MSFNSWKFFKFNEVFDKGLEFKDPSGYVKNSHINLENCDIYASGDIHGDLYLLMNILMDLAGLVEIKNKKKYDKFLKASHIDNKFQKYLDSITNDKLKDIDSKKKNDKLKDIGIQWKESINNTFLVLCGDLIDNKRNDRYDIQDVYGDKYIPYVEIKLLYLIYYLNYKAKENVGIIKVCGNHDYGNLKSQNRDWIENYSYQNNDEIIKDSKDMPYVRKDYFKYDNNLITSRLLFHMIFPLVRINEHFFMHGGMNIQYYNHYENVVELNKNFIECVMKKNNDEMKENNCEIFNDDQSGILWDRTMSSHDFYQEEIPKEYSKIFKDKVIIVGHCPFISTSSRICNNKTNEIYKSIFPSRKDSDKEDDHIIKSDSIRSSFKDNYSNICDGKNHGITGQYWDKKKKRVKLIRLDVGMSHGFDNGLFYKDEYNEKEKEDYYGRLPQIIHIKIENLNSEYEVITATAHNALIRNKRGIFKNLDDENTKNKVVNEMRLINKDINYRKYMKYKLKYNRLLKLV